MFAGITVVISILGLFLMGVAFVRGLAVGTSVTVALVMLASITLLPAVLGFAGRNIDRLSVRRNVKEIHSREGVWFRWSRLVQRRPWPPFLGALGCPARPRRPVPLDAARLRRRREQPEGRHHSSGLRPRRRRDSAPGSNGPLILAAEFPDGQPSRATLDGVADCGPSHARRRLRRPRPIARARRATPRSSG